MFEFDFGLGEDINMLRESVAGFATNRIAPRAELLELDYLDATTILPLH